MWGAPTTKPAANAPHDRATPKLDYDGHAMTLTTRSQTPRSRPQRAHRQ